MGEGTTLVRRSALGDVVLLGAVTAALDGPVTVVTAPEWASLAARLRGVHRVVPWPKDVPAATLRRELRGRIVDLQGSVRSAGFGGERIHKRSVRRRLRLWFGLGPRRPAVVDLYAEACGVRPAPAPWIDVPERPRDRLALIPGAAWATKRWSAARYRELAQAWMGRVVVLGGPGDEGACAAVADGVPNAEVLVEHGFDRTIDALASVRVALGGDTGLLHLAAACGARAVALFGPTHPDDGFFSHPGEVVQRALPCRPCTLHGRALCPLGDHACMALPADDVLAAVRRQWVAESP